MLHGVNLSRSLIGQLHSNRHTTAVSGQLGLVLQRTALGRLVRAPLELQLLQGWDSGRPTPRVFSKFVRIYTSCYCVTESQVMWIGNRWSLRGNPSTLISDLLPRAWGKLVFWVWGGMGSKGGASLMLPPPSPHPLHPHVELPRMLHTLSTFSGTLSHFVLVSLKSFSTGRVAGWQGRLISNRVLNFLPRQSREGQLQTGKDARPPCSLRNVFRVARRSS